MVQLRIGQVEEDHLLTEQRPFPDDTGLHVRGGQQRPGAQILEFFRKGVIVFPPQEGVIA